MLYVLNKTNFDIFKGYYSNSECIIDNMVKITTFLATVYIYSIISRLYAQNTFCFQCQGYYVRSLY